MTSRAWKGIKPTMRICRRAHSASLPWSLTLVTKPLCLPTNASGIFLWSWCRWVTDVRRGVASRRRRYSPRVALSWRLRTTDLVVRSLDSAARSPDLTVRSPNLAVDGAAWWRRRERLEVVEPERERVLAAVKRQSLCRGGGARHRGPEVGGRSAASAAFGEGERRERSGWG